MKINSIVAFIAFIFGICGSLVAFFVASFDSSLLINGIIAIIASCYGLIGVWLFNKNYKISIAMYVVAGICVLIGVSLFGVLGFMLYIVAAIVAYVEKYKATYELSDVNVHYFGNNVQVEQAPLKKDTNNFWLIPFSLVVILIILLFASNVGNPFESTDTLEISNLSITSEGYSMYTISCDLVPKKDYDYLVMQVIFYNANNAVIGKNSLVWNMEDPVKNETIKVSGTATTNSATDVPSRAEIYFYDSALSSNTTDAVYHQTYNLTSK